MANTVEIVVKATDKATGVLKSVNKGLSGFHDANEKTLAFLGKIGKVAAVAFAAVAGAAVAMGTDMVKTAISFETAFAGVIKTTEGLTSDFGVLNEAGQALKAGFKELSETKPIRAEELMRIGELGGQLGIGKDALLEFTGVIADLGVATALTTDAAAMDIARLMNIMQTAGGDVQRLGSVIVDLGNNFATTEPEILSFAERIAGAGRIAGLTEADVLGIGAAMSSVGVLAEAGGTAVQKVLLAMHVATMQVTGDVVDNNAKMATSQGKLADYTGRLEIAHQRLAEVTEKTAKSTVMARQKAVADIEASIAKETAALDGLAAANGRTTSSINADLKVFAQTAGMTAATFKELWEKDAGGAFDAFVRGLGAQGDKAIGTLQALELEDARLIRSFLALSGAGDLVTRAMDSANDAWTENTALTNEANQRYATTESQLGLLRNQWRNMKDDIGTALLPVVNQLVGTFAKFAQEHGPELVKLLQRRIIPAITDMAKAIGLLIGGDVGGALEALFGRELGDKIYAVAMSVKAFIDQVVAFVREHSEAFKAALITIGAVLAGAAIAGAIASIIAAISGLLHPIGLVIAAAALLAQAWANDWGGIRTKLTEAWEQHIQPALKNMRAWLEENVPAAIATLKTKWAELKERLQLDEKWDAILVWFSTAYDWLKIKIPEAIGIAVDWWWRLKAAWLGDDGVDTLAESSRNMGQPTLLERLVAQAGELARSLVEAVNPKIEELRRLLAPMPETILTAPAVGIDASAGVIMAAAAVIMAEQLAHPPIKEPTFWDKMKFVLDEVWAFIKESLIPTLNDLAGIALEAVKTEAMLVYDAMVKLWAWITGWLLPGIQAAAGATRDNTLALSLLGEKISDLIDVQIAAFLRSLDKVKVKFNDVAASIREARRQLELFNQTLQNSPAMGHSPSPFELSLQGISRTMRKMVLRDIPRFSEAIGGLNGTTAGIMSGVSGQRGMVAGNSQTSTANTYNLNIYTRAESEPIVADFNMMRAFAG